MQTARAHKELIVASSCTFLQQQGDASVSENNQRRLRLRLCWLWKRQTLMGRTGFVLEHQRSATSQLHPANVVLRGFSGGHCSPQSGNWDSMVTGRRPSSCENWDRTRIPSTVPRSSMDLLSSSLRVRSSPSDHGVHERKYASNIKIISTLFHLASRFCSPKSLAA